MKKLIIILAVILTALFAVKYFFLLPTVEEKTPLVVTLSTPSVEVTGYAMALTTYAIERHRPDIFQRIIETGALEKFTLIGLDNPRLFFYVNEKVTDHRHPLIIFPDFKVPQKRFRMNFLNHIFKFSNNRLIAIDGKPVILVPYTQDQIGFHHLTDYLFPYSYKVKVTFTDLPPQFDGVVDFVDEYGVTHSAKCKNGRVTFQYTTIKPDPRYFTKTFLLIPGVGIVPRH